MHVLKRLPRFHRASQSKPGLIQILHESSFTARLQIETFRICIMIFSLYVSALELTEFATVQAYFTYRRSDCIETIGFHVQALILYRYRLLLCESAAALSILSETAGFFSCYQHSPAAGQRFFGCCQHSPAAGQRFLQDCQPCRGNKRVPIKNASAALKNFVE